MGACCKPPKEQEFKIHNTDLNLPENDKLMTPRERQDMIENETKIKCKLCKQTIQGKNVITHQVIDGWSEYVQLFNNIGWKGHIPQTFNDCKKPENKEIFNLVKVIITSTKYKPIKIRTTQKLIYYLNKNECKLCHQHKQYLEDNLDDFIIPNQSISISSDSNSQ